jgi:hypothetical protein
MYDEKTTPFITGIYLRPNKFGKITQITFLTNSVAQEPEGSSPHSQQPVTGPYLSQSNPIHTPPSQSP